MRIRDIASGETINELYGRAVGITSPAFSPDGDTLAALFVDGAIFEWETTSGKLVRTVQCQSQATNFWGLAYSPDGQTLAAGTELKRFYW